MDAPVVSVEVERDIAHVVLRSPANRNALSTELLAGLHDAFDVADAEGVRGLVLGHEPPAFCAGADLSTGGVPDNRPLAHAVERLRDAPWVSIAAVAGPARAGGVGLMAACDLVVVRSDVTFAFTEVRLGLVPAIIAVPVLARCGAGAVRAPFLTGAAFDAHEARRIGLVDEVVDDVEAAVELRRDQLRRAAPGALAATRHLLGRSIDLHEAAELSARHFASDDGVEGLAAFRERRRPRWVT